MKQYDRSNGNINIIIFRWSSLYFIRLLARKRIYQTANKVHQTATQTAERNETHTERMGDRIYEKMGKYGGARQMDKEKVNYDMDYSAEQVHRMILHKNNIIDLKNQGNFKAAESLLDLQMLEQRYLTNNQRTVIYYVYERGHTLKQTAELLNTTKSKVVEILDSLLPTLQKYLRSDIV